MRRILRDTTAIAVGLSLGLPSFVSANALSNADAAQAAGQGALVKLAQADAPVVVVPGDAGAVAADAAKDADDAVKAAQDAAKAAADAARAAADAATAKPAKPADESKAADKPKADAEAKAEAPAADDAKAAADAARNATADAEKAAKEVDKQAADAKPVVEEPTKEPAKAADSDSDGNGDTQVVKPVVAEPKPAAEPTAEKAAEKPKAEPKAEPKAAETDSAAAARSAVDAAAQGGSGAVVATPEKADTAAGQKAPSAQTGDAAAKSDADIARALSERESTAAATTEAAKEAQAAKDAAPKAATGGTPVVTPAPDATAQQAAERDELTKALANAKAVPEVEAKETDAAREAAAETAAPAAAALADNSAPVVTTEKTEVTKDNSRAATEDFSTDLTGQARSAVAAATAEAGGNAAGQSGTVVVGDNQSADDNDDDSDLERALKGVVLPALAGMAVGSMLSNNREVALNTGDRVVVTRADGSQEVIKDDNALLFQPGSTVQTEEYADGSSRTVVTRADGSQVVTIRDADLRVLRRSVVYPDGTSTALIDETAAVQPVDVATLPRPAEPVVVLPGQQVSDEALREALRRETDVGRTFTLGQIRNIPEVRALVAPVEVQAITFDTGSAAIRPDQAQALSSLGRVLAEQIKENPREMFLIEGHTDTVGQDAMNLALSDRRAESVALALTEFFSVPPENMVVQGYGEQFLKLQQEGDVRANRRAVVRRITDLMAQK